MSKLNILVGTPANGGLVTLPHLNSLLDLQAALAQRGHAMKAMQTASMFLPKARNTLLSLFHERQEFSHLLFADSDIGFRPNLISRMIALGKPVVGIIAPHRSLNFANVAEAAKKTTDIRKLQRLSATYAAADIVRGRDGRIEPVEGFVEVTALSTALMLINREAAALIAEIPGLRVDDPSAATKSKKLIQGFMPLTDETTGIMLSEDVSFSRRWTGLGRPLWACIDEDITHTGQIDVVGRYLDCLE